MFRAIDGLQSRSVALAISSSQIAFATILTVIQIKRIFCSVHNEMPARLRNGWNLLKTSKGIVGLWCSG